MVNFRPFVKQLFVASATWLVALSVGGAISYPTVLLHQLRKNDTTIHLDFDTASWIGSIHGLAGIPCIFLPFLMQWQGRRHVFIAACLLFIIGWITAYTAQGTTALLVAESLHGLSTNSLLVVSFLSMTEMISPLYRHISIQLYGMLNLIVMATNGLLTRYLHWRTISLIMCAPVVLALGIGVMWPESPYWLAVKGKFERCEKSFIWIRGKDESSLKELKGLITAQKEILAENKRRDLNLFGCFCRRDFIRPMFYMFVLQCLIYWSGSMVILVYSVDIIQRVTHHEDISQFGGFIMNIVMCAGFFVCIGLNRYFSKKNILLFCTTCAVMCMSGASISSFLQSVGVLSKESLVCLCFLIGFTMAIGTGVYPIAYLFAIELIPVKHRGIGGALTELCTCLLHTSSLKLALYLLFYINTWGTFLMYAVNTLICGLIIWKFVPETTGRTLQEIEDYHNHGAYVQRIVADKSEELLHDG